jgi:hypothetical protein
MIFSRDILNTAPNSRLPSILSPIPPSNENQINNTQSIANHHRNLSRHIPRRVLRPESLRTNDIASTVPDQIKSSHCCLLCVPCYITGDEGQDRGTGCEICLRHVVAYEPCNRVPVAMCRKSNNQEKTDNRGSHGDGSNQCAVLEAPTGPVVRQTSDDDDDSTWDAVEEALRGCVSEAHDQLAEEGL